MDPNVLIVNDFVSLDVLRSSELNDPWFKASKYTEKRSEDQGLEETEVVEDAKLEEVGLQRRSSKQAHRSSPGDILLNVAPLQ